MLSLRQPKPIQAGFTILELMVATSVFSVILLVVAVGVLSFTNSYYKGVNSTNTQTANRNIVAALTQSIQFGKTVTLLSSAGAQGVCVDNTLYSYVLGQEVVDSAPVGPHQAYQGLVVASSSDCANASPNVPNTPNLPTGSRELLGPHMRLNAFSVTQLGNLYVVHVRVLFGDDDLFTPAVTGSTNWSSTTENCAGGAGSQFCAVSDFTTTVDRRLL